MHININSSHARSICILRTPCRVWHWLVADHDRQAYIDSLGTRSTLSGCVSYVRQYRYNYEYSYFQYYYFRSLDDDVITDLRVWRYVVLISLIRASGG
jgi:hypothetical protein